MENKTTKVTGLDLPVSTKHVIEISNFIKHKNLQKAKVLLEQVLKFKIAVPYTRFNKNVGHRSGDIAAGRYPIKAAKEILNLLNSLEANAQNQGLDTSSLIISEIIPNKASRPWHYGRQRRRKMKRTHIKIVAKEVAKKTLKKETKSAKPETKKEQTKK